VIGRLALFVRLVVFVAASWIVAVVIWGLATGVKPIETPLVAVWIVICGLIAQLSLWFISKVTRRT
jgi:hypothetical protein